MLAGEWFDPRDEEMEGYYIGEPVLEIETVRRALMEAGAFA